MILEWSELYQQELIDNWNRARARRTLAQIPPLS